MHAQQSDSPENEQPAAVDEQIGGLHQAEVQLFRLANEDRRQSGLDPLRFDDDLVAVARARASEQTVASGLSHVDASGGVAFASLMEAAGVSAPIAGEALVWVSGPEPELVPFAHELLVHSESHRALLLDPRFTYLAVGGVASTPTQMVFAQIFSAR